MLTPDQRPGHMLVIDGRTRLTQRYNCFPHVTEEQYQHVGIPEPVDLSVPSVNFLEWINQQLPEGHVDADIYQRIKSRFSINPYVYEPYDMATISIGSDSYLAHGWSYPALDTKGSFQLITADSESQSAIQLEVPSLRGIERWAAQRGPYEHLRFLGIQIVDELENDMIGKFQEKLLPLVCKSFTSEGIRINPKKLSPTRSHNLEGYIDVTSREPSVNKEKKIAGVKGSFAVLTMEFEVS